MCDTCVGGMRLSASVLIYVCVANVCLSLHPPFILLLLLFFCLDVGTYNSHSIVDVS